MFDGQREEAAFAGKGIVELAGCMLRPQPFRLAEPDGD